jgi:hypothetical protein
MRNRKNVQAAIKREEFVDLILSAYGAQIRSTSPFLVQKVEQQF